MKRRKLKLSEWVMLALFFSAVAFAIVYNMGCETSAAIRTGAIQAKQQADEILAEAQARGDVKTAAAAKTASETAGKIIDETDPNKPHSEDSLTELANKLPPPWNVLAALGVSVFPAARNRQYSAATKSIVNTLDKLRMASPAVRDAMASNKMIFMDNLTPLAKKIIDSERMT